MATILTRTNLTDLEVRSDGRTVFGTIVPYDSPAPIIEGGRYSYTESFARGAFRRLTTDAAAVGRVKLLAQHDQATNPLGRAIEMRDEARGLMGAFRVSDTAAGNDALALVRDGALDSFSIGFSAIPGTDTWNATRTEVVRREAKLHHVGLVTFGAYEGAQVAGIRAALPHMTGEAALLRLALRKRVFQ